MIPRRRPDQSHDDHQAEMAEWLRAPSVEHMNGSRDRWHVSLAHWLGATSNAMRDAVGAPLTQEEAELAAIEEEAVLHLQRYANVAGAPVPPIARPL